MKFYLRPIFTGLLFLMSAQIYSQGRILKAGLNMATLQSKNDDLNIGKSATYNPGFHLGVLMEFPLSGIGAIESGILIQTKGSRVVVENTSSSFKSVNSLNVLYLDVPITLKVKSEIKDNLYIYGNFGPYVGYALNGKIKDEVEFNGTVNAETEDLQLGSRANEDDLKRGDWGLTFGAGLEINTVVFGLGYDLGIANITNVSTKNTVVRNRVLRVSLGFKIGDE